MKSQFKSKLANLPHSPGVYFFYDNEGQIIYIGKASILKRRVSSYFQTRSSRDRKTAELIKHITDLSIIEVGSEMEALFLEAELIKRHKPLYNIRERDDTNFIYIKITAEDYPRVLLVRRPIDDSARYIGPFISSYEIKKSLRILRRNFPYYSDAGYSRQSKLDHQIGVAPKPDISKSEYRQTIAKLVMILTGRTKQLQKKLQREMKQAAAQEKFEKAKLLRDQLFAVESLSAKIIFGNRESVAVAADLALSGLMEVLQLPDIPRRIEAYDISNFAGADAVASMIVFTDGLPDHAAYKKFKMRAPGPNDFAMMHEVISRRFAPKNSKWPKPDLLIIDGGKGQLSSALGAMSESGVSLPAVGLAKRLEQIVRFDGKNFEIINLPLTSVVIQLMQRIRDEAHRFAVSYHTSLRDKRVRGSKLDQIPGVGPATRKKLLRQFGSVAGVRQADLSELSSIVGAKAQTIKEYLK